MAETQMMTAALSALERGWSVFPVQTRGEYAKRPHWCLVDTGHTKDEGGKVKPSWAALQHTRPTADQVRTWYAKSAGKGLAVVTGAVSGLVILDFDGPQGEQLRAELGLPAHARTGSGGAHVYFQHPGWRVPTLNSKAKREMGERWPGLDIRADGGYAVMPPSENASGPYSWEAQPGLPELLALTALPDDLRAFLGLAQPPAVSPPAPRAAEPSRAFQGQARDDQGRVSAALLIERALEQAGRDGRNNAGAWLAAQLRDNGYSEGEAAGHMDTYAAQVPPYDAHGVHSPYTAGEARATLRSMYSMPPREPWGPGRARQHPAPGATFPQSAPEAQPIPSPALSVTKTGPVIVTGEARYSEFETALRQPHAGELEARRTLTGEELRTLVQDGRPVYILTPSQAQERALDASGVEWYALPPLPLTAAPEELLDALQAAMSDALPITGSLSFLQDELPGLADSRLSRGGNTYPTGLTDFDEAIGGGFYDGLHVLGGVTGGGKTALALAIAEHNARQGRPILYVTFEQSRYELWGRIISTRAGVSLRQLRTGGTAERPVGDQLRQSAAYHDLTQNVAPYLSVFEGNGVDGGAWGVDRIAAQ
ncbi:bifunctional DNA primase/polymerase, partial [Deinococcus sp. RL]|uniref:bifunctional DNA primase/polymerase n=1 Tax=Deinococcus sp. RL TaxID=1489678 RepID=UPI0013773D4C